MGKLVVSLDGVVIKEVQITKDKTTLGRRPYNDIVIDNLAVSGEHAVLQMVGSDVFIEDLNSTNGTYINGKAIKKQLLTHNDTVEIGKYKIKFLVDDSGEYEKTMIMRPGGSAPPLGASSPTQSAHPAHAGGPASNFGGLGAAARAATVLAGEGGHFCAGADLRRTLSEVPNLMDRLEEYMDDFHGLIRAIVRAPKPVIAMVDGARFAQKNRKSLPFEQESINFL